MFDGRDVYGLHSGSRMFLRYTQMEEKLKCRLEDSATHSCSYVVCNYVFPPMLLKECNQFIVLCVVCAVLQLLDIERVSTEFELEKHNSVMYHIICTISFRVASNDHESIRLVFFLLPLCEGDDAFRDTGWYVGQDRTIPLQFGANIHHFHSISALTLSYCKKVQPRTRVVSFCSHVVEWAEFA